MWIGVVDSLLLVTRVTTAHTDKDQADRIKANAARGAVQVEPEPSPRKYSEPSLLRLAGREKGVYPVDQTVLHSS